MANIQFSYLYRDGSNYKNHRTIIFANPDNLGFTEISALIKSKLIDDTWFYADKWGLPDLRLANFDVENDPTWHEFESIDDTSKSANAPFDLNKLISTINNLLPPSFQHR